MTDLKKKVYKWTVTIIVFLLLITGCSYLDKYKNVEKESTDDPVSIEEEIEEVEEEIISDVLDLTNEEDADEEDINEVEDSIVEDIEEVIVPLNSEIEIINSLLGGFFYSQSNDIEYKQARIKAIDIFNTQVVEVLEDNMTLLNSLTIYEEEVLFFIDSIDKSKVEYDQDFQYIIEHILAYKTMLSAISQEANGYLTLTGVELESELNKAVIDYEVYNNTVELYKRLDEYASFLVITSEYLATGMADNFDEIYGDSIRQKSKSSFEEYVVEDLAQLTMSYLVMCNMYTHISSADYYESLEVRNHSLVNIKDMDNTGVGRTLYPLIQTEPKKPDYLIEAINKESNEIGFIEEIFSWINIHAYAEDNLNTLATKVALLETIELIERNERVNGDLPAEDVKAAMIAMIFRAKEIKDILIKEKIANTPSFPEIHQNMTGNKKNVDANSSDEISDKDMKTIQFFGALEMITYELLYESDDGPIPEELKEEYKEIVVKTNAIPLELISQEQRAAIIKGFKDIRNTKEALGAKVSFLFAPETISDLVFNSVIKNLFTALDKNKGNISSEVYNQLHNLLNNDLQEILGNSKVEFATMFFNGSADEMVNAFVDWINNSDNRQELKIDRNYLIDLLNIMGIKHNGVKEDVDNSNEEIVSEPTDNVDPTNGLESNENEESSDSQFESIEVRSLEGWWNGDWKVVYDNGKSNEGDSRLKIEYNYDRDEIYILLYDDTIYLDPYSTNIIEAHANEIHGTTLSGTLDFNLTMMSFSAEWTTTYYEWSTGKVARTEYTTYELTHEDFYVE